MTKPFENPDHWDNAAEHYAQTAHPFTARFAEAALAQVPIGSHSRILDVACGTGALALAAARTGAQVVATDFSPGMVRAVAAAGLPNVEARVMDGQALDLPDASFDASFSIFGVIMFPDWREGLHELARVTRPGGHGVIATWQSRGAATFLLLSQIRETLFPGREGMAMPEGVRGLSDPRDFADELLAAGFDHIESIEPLTIDFPLDLALLDRPENLFGMSADWTSLNAEEQALVIAEVRRRADGSAMLPIPSTALIGVAVR